MQKASRDERRAFWALRTGSLVLPVLAALIWGLIAYRGEVDSKRDLAETNAVLIGQYIARLVQTQTVLHDAVRAEATAELTDAMAAGEAPDAYLRGAAFHEYLAALDGNDPASFGLAVLSTRGDFIASSRAFPVHAKSGPRDYLAAVERGVPLFIDRIKVQPGAMDAVVIATPLDLPGGAGRLAVVSAISTGLVSEFLRGLAPVAGEAASIMREDGYLLVRSIPGEPMQLPPTARIREEIGKHDSGSYFALAATDQIERLYAYRKLDGLPLYANFGTPSATLRADWLRKALPVWLLLALLGAFSLLTARRLRQRMTARFELEAAHRRIEAAERLAEERIRLMRETNHRVKNNLSLIVSLINMQMRGKTGIDGNELKARIGAISRVHDLMYQASDGVHVDFSETLREIAGSPAIVPREQGIEVICEAEPGIVLGPETTTPLAIIAAELLTNAVKHAFSGREAGTIRVGLKRRGETGVMEVSDNGVGLPALPPRRSGAAIIDALVAQIGGQITRDTGASGASMRVSFPLPAM